MTLPALDLLWRYALAAIPMALAVAAVCRLLPCRPTTRHAMWLTTLLFLVVAPFVPRVTVDDASKLLADARRYAGNSSAATARLALTLRPTWIAAPDGAVPVADNPAPLSRTVYSSW